MPGRRMPPGIRSARRRRTKRLKDLQTDTDAELYRARPMLGLQKTSAPGRGHRIKILRNGLKPKTLISTSLANTSPSCFSASARMLRWSLPKPLFFTIHKLTHFSFGAMFYCKSGRHPRRPSPVGLPAAIVSPKTGRSRLTPGKELPNR
jgi:hypothetical protein